MDAVQVFAGPCEPAAGVLTSKCDGFSACIRSFTLCVCVEFEFPHCCVLFLRLPDCS